MTCDDIDQIVHEKIISLGAYPSCIGFMNFPKSVCTSVNEVVSHGVPNSKVLEDGDSVNIDVTAYFKGHFGDTSAMVHIGDVHPDVQRLVPYS
jgi:methionyl aminopeptidase